MSNLSSVIIMEGDSNIARLFCGVCNNDFRADVSRVANVKGTPVCLQCIDDANPKRKAMGLPELNVIRDAYLND
jgi:hypothetical protein